MADSLYDFEKFKKLEIKWRDFDQSARQQHTGQKVTLSAIQTAVAIPSNVSAVGTEVGTKQRDDNAADYPDEDKKLRYVIQAHSRGRAIHLDARFEYKRGNDHYLRGWTIMAQQPDAIKEPVTTMEQAHAALANADAWKLDLKTGIIKPRQIRGGVVRRGDLRAVPKAEQIPKDWISVEGVSERPDPGEAIPAGSTVNFPGVFVIVAKGTVEWGAQKPWAQEFFLDGDWKGRWLFRLVERKGEKWYAPENEAEYEAMKAADVLPSGVEEANARTAAYWLLMQPEDAMPYALSADAVTKDWLPPRGISALPARIRKSIPDALRYWEQDEKQALESRRTLVEDYEELGGPKMAHKESGKFVLARRTWKGQTVIRMGLSTVVHDLYLDTSEPGHWTLAGDPTRKDSVAAQPASGGKVQPADGAAKDVFSLSTGDSIDVQPGSALNPTKDTPCTFEVLDKGAVQVLSDDAAVKKYDFDGDVLKGGWLFVPEDEADPRGFWLASKSGGPKVKGGEGSGNFGHAGRPGEVGGSAPDSGNGGMHFTQAERLDSLRRDVVQIRERLQDTSNPGRLFASLGGDNLQHLKSEKTRASEEFLGFHRELLRLQQELGPDADKSPDWDRLVSEKGRTDQEWSAALKNAEEYEEMLLSQCRDLLMIDNPIELEYTVSGAGGRGGKTGQGIRSALERAVADIQTMVSDQIPLSDRDFSAFISRTGERPYAVEETRVMVLDVENSERAVAHEWGHIWESHDSEARSEAIEFLNRRTFGEHSVPLGGNHDSGEYTRPDKFYSPYVGKVYDGEDSTEVLSMGLEAYIYDPVAFARQDPEHFDLIYRLVHRGA